MKMHVTDAMIRSLCGRFAYEEGEQLFKAGAARLVRHVPDADSFTAEVEGDGQQRVTVAFTRKGQARAHCSCPLYHPDDLYCKHIAAVLFQLRSLPDSDAAEDDERAVQAAEEPRGGAGSRENGRLAEQMLRLFGSGSKRRLGAAGAYVDRREPLEAEFVLSPVQYGYRKYIFGVEMKVGTGKRLYVVPKIRDFLERYACGETFSFSKHFTYDPEMYSMPAENDAIMKQLLHIVRHEALYKETAGNYQLSRAQAGGDRSLLIPPFAWSALFPLLRQAPAVRLLHKGQLHEGLEVADGPLPLQFSFAESPVEGFVLTMNGLEDMTLLEAYGAFLLQGTLWFLQDEQCNWLSHLQQMAVGAGTPQLHMPLERLETFIEKVVPGLMKLGSVHMDTAVSERLLSVPLRAKLYLDRVKNRLLAGLEFQYGDITVNPLEAREGRRASARILLRDGERETRILELMEQSAFVRTESGYFLDDEEGEYDFLQHIVPELEQLATIYATPAVKARLYPGPIAPQITVEIDERTDWLEFTFQMDGIPEADIRKMLKSLSEKRKYHRLPDGALLPLDGPEFQDMVRLMNELGVRGGALTGKEFRIPAARGLHWLEERRQGQAVRLGKSVRQLLEHLRHPDSLEFPLPESLAPVLRDYQAYGFQWLKTLAHYRFGGILADDMGLGKTLQSIAFLLSELPDIRAQGLPALIVSPASLMYNWRNELSRFAPQLRAVVADGSRTERSRALREAERCDVLIVSYPLLHRDIDMYARRSFHTLILDEAQAFKNHTTQTAQAVKAIQARYRFALTGTPVENRLEELWSLFEAVLPGLFPSRKAFNELSRHTVALRARPFLLRRLKSDVLRELPDKIETLQASELLPEQKKLYAAYLVKLQQETLKHLEEKGFDKSRIQILAGLTRLRQLCCHPALFVEDYAGGSAKLEQLLQIIDECRSAGKRLLVFSQFTQMLGLIGSELGKSGVPFFYLDGSTPAAERVELCSRFNAGERELFLISLKAGGSGLNLVGADTVVLYDLWWNPAVEQQAADRAHRIGQKKVVQVIRLVSQGTVEDKMYELQQKKKHLIEEVIQPGQEALAALTEQELRDILQLA